MPHLHLSGHFVSATSLTDVVVPKSRKLKFDLHLKIIDLNNVPYVSGKSFIKWNLPNSTAAEHRGRTEKCSIKEHRVQYNYEAHIPVRLTIDKAGVLQEAFIYFEVLHEVVSGDKGERIALGNVKLNLAEYVWASEQEGDESVCGRYLMQDSKINSTLKIGLYIKQTEGDRNYVAPPLKSAPVFGGIAGIVAGERGDVEDVGHLPTLDNKSREADEQLRELYRRTIAADWTCQPGEMSADRCIEDIFAGGDGWGNRVDGQDDSPISDRAMPGAYSASLSDSEARAALKNSKQRNWSGLFGRRHQKRRSVPERIDKDEVLQMRDTSHGVRGRGSFEQEEVEMKAESETGRNRHAHELDEFEVRDDLRCWRLPN